MGSLPCHGRPLRGGGGRPAVARGAFSPGLPCPCRLWGPSRGEGPASCAAEPLTPFPSAHASGTSFNWRLPSYAHANGSSFKVKGPDGGFSVREVGCSSIARRPGACAHPPSSLDGVSLDCRVCRPRPAWSIGSGGESTFPYPPAGRVLKRDAWPGPQGRSSAAGALGPSNPKAPSPSSP